MKVGLVLEGGGMRGLYTAGILDCFIDDKIVVDTILGVSAGAVFGINYPSLQKGRTLRYNKKYLNDKRYMSFSSFIKTGNFVNKDFAYYEVPFKLDVFDEEAFEKSKVEFYAVMTNIETGEAEYSKIVNACKQIEELRASSSLPFLSKPVIINEKKYLDGGIGDSIPIDRALELGLDKIIVVKTRPRDYRKKKTNTLIPKMFYHKYPLFVKKINDRYLRYNETLDKLYKLEKDNKIFIIEPSKTVNISRMEHDPLKLEEMYNLGINDYKNIKNDLINYLKK